MDAALSPLPPRVDLETKAVLKKLSGAHRQLAELKGNIRHHTQPGHPHQHAGPPGSQRQLRHRKHRHDARRALQGRALARGRSDRGGQRSAELFERNRAGFRKLPGTELVNDRTGEVIYRPPQGPATVLALMSNLETFINDDSLFNVSVATSSRRRVSTTDYSRRCGMKELGRNGSSTCSTVSRPQRGTPSRRSAASPPPS